MDAISGRGREIAAYDAAAWHGTDAVLALHPIEARVRRKPQVPEYIVSQSFYFRIDVDGQITAYDRDSTVR